MNSSLLVMVVEDHDALRESTILLLEKEGFQTVGVSCAEEIDDTRLPRKPDVYVLDLNLPGEDGLSLAKRLRQAQPLSGIIMTTARTQLNDRLIGYSSGADIYLPKPVEPAELVATLCVLGKRQQLVQAPYGLLLNKDQLLLTGPGGKCRLAVSEAGLLAAFATAKEQTLERWQVSVHLSQEYQSISADNLQNRISQLRKKMASCGIEGESLKAIRANGYRLCVVVKIV